MKFEISRASDWTEQPSKNAYPGKNEHGVLLWFIDINTINDLLNLIKETESDLIIGKNTIKIYDDCVE